MRIRNRLLTLVFAILVPALVGASLGIYYVYTEQQRTYQKTISDLTRSMSLLLDKEMRGRARTLQTLAASPTLTNNDLAEFHRFAHEVASDWVTAVVLSDLQGQQLLNTRSPFGAPNLPKITSSLVELRAAAGPEQTLISDIYFAPIGKKPSFAIQVPVMRDKEVRYYLGMGSFTTELQELLLEQQLPANWIASIVDRKGMIAARTHEPEKYVGTSASAFMKAALAARDEGSMESTTLNGVAVTAFFTRAPMSGWRVIFSVPRAEQRAAAIRATAAAAGIAFLLLGLGVAAAITIARNIARPLEDLRLIAADLSNGRSIARRASGLVETDAVSLEIAHASEKIRNANAELERRVAEAIEHAERSQKALLHSQKLEALGRLTGGIAHDFNNVLQTLSTGMQFLLMSVGEERHKNTIQACQRAIARASDLTKQMLAFGRVQDANLVAADLGQQMARMEPLLKGGLRGNIDMQVDIPQSLWPVMLDPGQFELAMLNLVINARDAMPDGGRLLISMANLSLERSRHELAPGDYVRIAVVDSGTGMAPEVVSKALEPFYTTKAVGEGSGLGLPQAYGFARQANGTLAIDSSPGAGTTITIYLPRAGQQAAAAEITKAVTAGSATATAPGAAPLRILFVEDDPLVAAVVGPALTAAGFAVVEAHSGDHAMALLARQEEFDVVFSDIVMPGRVSGIDLADHVQKQHPATRVILATGYSHRRLALPGVEILAKPYDVVDLIRMLGA